MTITIKSWFNGKILYTSEKATIKEAVGEAVNKGADLSGANLWGAHLSGANLSGAHMRGADMSGANLWGAKGIFIINFGVKLQVVK